MSKNTLINIVRVIAMIVCLAICYLIATHQPEEVKPETKQSTPVKAPTRPNVASPPRHNHDR